MKRKVDWKKELDNLNIPYEIIDGKIYLWPQYRNSKGERYPPSTLREIYQIIKKYRPRFYTNHLKEADHTSERAKTRQMIINNEDFPKGKVHDEDTWWYD